MIPLDRGAPLTGEEAWANYVFGVVAGYRDAGHAVQGFEAAFIADLPIGAGLSSSAALEAATALVTEAFAGIELPAKERALLCQAAEHRWAGVPCGNMDQLAVNCGIDGHALEIDCLNLEIRPAPLPGDLAIVVVDSKVKHELADGEYAKRRADCEAAAAILGVPVLREADAETLNSARPEMEDRVFRRARHVISEINRVRDFSKALANRDINRAGQLLAESHASLRDDFEVSCPELDELVEIAVECGALGSRMMGGGFGGSTVNLVPFSKADEFAKNVSSTYQHRSGAAVDAFRVRPVGGAFCQSHRENQTPSLAPHPCGPLPQPRR